MSAIHSTKISGNFGPKLNGSVRSNRKSFEKTGPPFEVVPFSRSDRLEFWLNGSRPLCINCDEDIRGRVRGDLGTRGEGSGNIKHGTRGRGDVKYRDAEDVGTLMFTDKVQVAVAKIYLEQEHSIPNK